MLCYNGFGSLCNAQVTQQPHSTGLYSDPLRSDHSQEKVILGAVIDRSLGMKLFGPIHMKKNIPKKRAALKSDVST